MSDLLPSYCSGWSYFTDYRTSSMKVSFKWLPCVQEVVTPFYIVSYYIKWGNYFLDTGYNIKRSCSGWYHCILILIFIDYGREYQHAMCPRSLAYSYMITHYKKRHKTFGRTIYLPFYFHSDFIFWTFLSSVSHVYVCGRRRGAPRAVSCLDDWLFVDSYLLSGP